MLSVDTFRSKFKPVKRESVDIRDWGKKVAYKNMDVLKNGDRTSSNGSSIQSKKSLCSELSGSLLSSDVSCKEELDISSTETHDHSGKCSTHQSDAEHMQEILKLLSTKKQLLFDPVLKEVLQQCENILRETKITMPLDFQVLGPSHADDFVMVKKDQLFQESSTLCNKAEVKTHKGSALSQPRAFLSNLFKNLAESRRYKELGRSGSYSSGDLRVLGQQTNISRFFEAQNCPVISSTLDCPTNNQFNREPSCAVLGVLNVCEHCKQPIEEPLEDDHFSTSPCIVCQKSFRPSEMEGHLKKHSSIEELD